MPDQHALLSASSAERWLHCTPAPRLEETLPEKTSEYAEEGRLAHSIAELKLRSYFYPGSKRSFTAAMNKLKKDALYQEEMQRYTDVYLDFIKETAMSFGSPPSIMIEKRLDYSTFAPEGFGTGDCIVLSRDTLHIGDFKYGQGVPVDAKQNPQMMLYALGAIQEFSPFYDIQRVILHIIQPRRDSVSTWETTRDDLVNWGTLEVRPRAQLAFKGEGEYAPGGWCQFCRAAGRCRAQKDTYTPLSKYESALPPLLTDEEVGTVLGTAQGLKKWAGKLEDYALTAILEGKAIPGWKAVAGRSNRAFGSVDAALQVLKENGTDESLLYRREPLPLTEIEGFLGKAEFNRLLGGHIVKPQGKPTLAPESDNREPFKTNDAKSDFAEIVKEHAQQSAN